jgi:hypothetical protein
MRWHPTTFSETAEELRVHATTAARVELVDGRWRAILWLGYEQKHRLCTSKEAGKAGCEAWARRHMAHFDARYAKAFEHGSVFAAFRHAGAEKSDRPRGVGVAS